MSEVRWMDTNEMVFVEDTRFPSIAVKLLESHSTHPAVSVIIARVAPGGAIPRHVHPTETETAYVLSGTGRLLTENGEYTFKPGIAVTIPPGLMHEVINDSDMPLEVFALHSPGTR